MCRRVKAWLGIGLLVVGYGYVWSVIAWKTEVESLYLHDVTLESRIDRQVMALRAAGETPTHGVIGFRNDLPSVLKNAGAVEDPFFRLTVQYAMAPVLVVPGENHPVMAVIEDDSEVGKHVRLERRPERP